MSRYIQADLSQCKYTIIGVTDRLIDQGQTPRLLHKVYQKKGRIISLEVSFLVYCKWVFLRWFLLHVHEVGETEWDTLQVTCVLSGGLFLVPHTLSPGLIGIDADRNIIFFISLNLLNS